MGNETANDLLKKVRKITSGRTRGIQFWGTSFVAGPQGEILYEASDTEEESIVIEIDIAHSEQVRRWWPFLRDRRIDDYGEITKRFRRS